MNANKKRFRLQFRWAAMTTLVLLLLLLCIFMVTGCSSDADSDDYLPPYQQTLCELITDSHGNGVTIRFDDGRERPLITPATDLTPDSLYRISGTTYEREDGVELYNAQVVFSPMPISIKPEKVKTDPVGVLAAWRDKRYINMRLSVKRASDAAHYMGFAEMGTRYNFNGTRTKTIRFVHDRNGDNAYYKQELLVSCPVYHLGSELREGTDSICLIVHTEAGEYTTCSLY